MKSIVHTLRLWIKLELEHLVYERMVLCLEK